MRIPAIGIAALLLVGCSGSQLSAPSGPVPGVTQSSLTEKSAAVSGNPAITEFMAPMPPGDITIGVSGAPCMDYASGTMRFIAGQFQTFPYPSASFPYYNIGGIVSGTNSGIFTFAQQNQGFGILQNYVARLNGSNYTIAPSGSGSDTPDIINDATLGPDASVWNVGFFPDLYGSEGYVTATNPVTLQQQRDTVSFIRKNSVLNALTLTVGPDRAVWVYAENSSGNPLEATLFRFSSALKVTSKFPVTGARIRFMTTGNDGNIWFTDSVNNAVGKVTLTGTATEYPLPTPSAGPARITSAPDGTLWFTEQNASKVARVTTAGKITEYATPSAKSFPTGIVAGPRGSATIWFVEAGTGKLGKLVY